MSTTTIDLPASYIDASERVRYLRSPSQGVQVHISMIHSQLKQYAENGEINSLHSAVALASRTLALTNNRDTIAQLVHIVQDVTRTMEWHLRSQSV